ncbi:hypothetical protein K3495_g3625 [Podosphaera aphanis]|nr:hypothetical protein K3495_g3625 [Podosphaera aphanis]
MSGATSSPLSLDAVDYDPIEHLNLIFYHPSTLSRIGPTADALKIHQNDLSSDIALLSAQQARNNDVFLKRIQSTKSELSELFSKIESVQTRAIETEQTITSMTAEIKRLDSTKRNITLSMTTLKRLQMLTAAYEQLRGLAKTRQYKDCGGLVQAVLQLMKHFNSYRSIDQIATLSRNVADLQRELLEQVCEDFEISFAKGEITTKTSILAEACLVVDALGDHARARLVTWYVNTLLREYRQLFRGNDEAGSLDNIGRRYSWFKRILTMHEERHAEIFPREWRVNEILANTFCDETKDDLKGMVERSMRKSEGTKVDVDLLLDCLQQTMEFENRLEKKFASVSRSSIDTLNSVEEKTQTFERSISKAFEPYLSLWVESRDRSLASMIPQYQDQALLPPDEEFSPQAVIGSSIELFHFYKTTLAQGAKLSTGVCLLELSKTFAKYLDEYAQQVLMFNLQTSGSPSLQNTILILNTADYWHSNSQQLEENLKKRIDPDLSSRVDLSSQADVFMGVASAAVLVLVNRVGRACEASWREMRNMNWSKMESAGDQSSYVAEILQQVNSQTQEILPLVAKQQYTRAFCDNLIEDLATAYVVSIVQCRPISEVGAEQILLDKYVLMKSLGNILSHSPHPISATTTANFAKRVQNTLSRLDPLLKTIQVRPSPPEGLVQAYLIHISDRSDANFRKILDLKGLPKSQQPSLVELFAVHRDGKANDHLVPANPLLTPLNTSTGNSGFTKVTAGTTVTGAGKAFDPATFGEKLFGTAKETGEKIGSEETKATMEGNLKSIGKFFRRDMSGFGRFGSSWQGYAEDNTK